MAGDHLVVNCTASTAGRYVFVDGVLIGERVDSDRFDSTSYGTTTIWTIDPVLPGDAGEYVCNSGAQNIY